MFYSYGVKKWEFFTIVCKIYKYNLYFCHYEERKNYFGIRFAAISARIIFPLYYEQ